MAVQTSLLPEEKVFEANAIARAEWRTSNVWIQRIVAILVNKINPSDKKFSRSKIPLQDIMLDSTKGGTSYHSLRGLIGELASQHVIINVPKTKKDLAGYNIFDGAFRYYDNEKAIEVCLNEALRPFYLELKSHFVAYGLTEFLSLPGIYHQSLYKLLKSWESEPYCVIDLKELHKILGATPSLKRTYTNFDQRALAPAHKFINERTSLKYGYEPQKVGRKVVSVIFTFKSKPKIKKAPPKAKKTTPKPKTKR